VSTIWRILTRRGFIIPDPAKAPNTTWKRFVAASANEMWQTDATYTELADGTEVDVVNIIDDHSRACVRAHAVDGSTTGTDAWDVFVQAVGTYGISAWLLSDNGPLFTSKLFTNNLAAPPGQHHQQPTVPPPDLRESRTVPPDPQEMARSQTQTRHGR
jgi:transposase InsO family protein